MKYAVRAIIERGDKIVVMHRNKFGQEYYNLIGGGVEMGETLEQALVREVAEESSLQIKDFRLVFVEDAGRPYGIHYTFLCKDPGGEIYLSDSSIEAELNRQGQNLYKVEWLPKTEFSKVEFVSKKLQKALVDSFENGFPEKTVVLE